MPEKKVTSLVWFRNNLRVIDNLSLKKSVENSDKVIGSKKQKSLELNFY